MSHPACCDRDIWELPPVDTSKMAAAAEALAARGLLGAASPEQRAATAAGLLESCNAGVPRARAARDAAAYWVTQDFHIRRGANLPAAVGVTRVRWKLIRDRFVDNPPPRVRNPLSALKSRATALAEMEAFQVAATAARDAAVAELVAAGWHNAKIARLIGRDPSRVSTLRYRESAA